MDESSAPAGRPAPGGVPAPRPPLDSPPAADSRPQPGPSGGNGLHPLVRRVPGAQLPVGARAARPPAEPGGPDRRPGAGEPADDAADDAVRDAAAARALVEEFEAGVERALRTGERGTGPMSGEGAG